MCDPNFTTLLQVKCNMAPREIKFHHPLLHLKLHKIDQHYKAFSGKSGSEVGEAQTFANQSPVERIFLRLGIKRDNREKSVNL